MSASILPDPQTPEQRRLYAEAMRIADERGYTSAEGFERLFKSLCHREWQQVIQPWLKLKADVYAARIPTKMWMVDGGPLQVEYEPLSPVIQEHLAQIDEAIQSEARRYGLADQP